LIDRFYGRQENLADLPHWRRTIGALQRTADTLLRDPLPDTDRDPGIAVKHVYRRPMDLNNPPGSSRKSLAFAHLVRLAIPKKYRNGLTARSATDV